MDAVRILSIIF